MGSSGKHFCLQWKNHQKNFIAVTSELLDNNSLTDVTLGVEDGRSIECHKMILAACSSYFQSLFRHYPGSHPYVVLSGVKYPEVMRLVEFMYKGEVNVPQDEFDGILKLAETLQVKGLTGLTDANLPLASNNTTDVTNNNDTTNVTVRPPVTTKTASKHRRKSYFPAHSTSRPYHAYEETPVNRSQQQAGMPSSPPNEWRPQCLPSPQTLATTTTTTTTHYELPTVPVNFSLSSPASSLSPIKYSYPQNDETYNDNVTPNTSTPSSRIRKRKMSRQHVINRPTAILQTALKQSQTNVQYPIVPSTYIEHHNETIYDNNTDTANIHTPTTKNDNSLDMTSLHTSNSPCNNTQGSINGDNKTTEIDLSTESQTGIASSSPSAVQDGGKRYKRYSKTDLVNAIDAVRDGMSANKAALLFKLPSRTLYDKIKRLGYTNSKNRRSGNGASCSSSNSSRSGTNPITPSSAAFPYGIGGNVDGSIYGNYMMDNDSENSHLSIDSSANMSENFRDENFDRENIAKENDRKTPSPENRFFSQSPIKSQQERTPIKQETSLTRDPSCTEENNDENEAEDLSVSRKRLDPDQILQSKAIEDET